MSNDTETLTLSGFLLARSAEDEESARAASPGPWRYPPIRGWKGVVMSRGGCLWAPMRGRDGCLNHAPDGDHIARHDPARVLADCEVKRRIVERCSAVDYAMPCTPLAHGILGELAAPYANHPDFDERWRQ